METEKPKRKMPVSPGRPKGTPNKTTGQIKEMVVQALHEAGGVQYLVTQAKKNPKAFLALLGRVLPLQVTGAGEGGALLIQHVTRTVIDVTPNDHS